MHVHKAPSSASPQGSCTDHLSQKLITQTEAATTILKVSKFEPLHPTLFLVPTVAFVQRSLSACARRILSPNTPRYTRTMATTNSTSGNAPAESTQPPTDTTASEASKPTKLHGRAFYESLGSPKFVLAPMVDQSEFVRPPHSPPTLRSTS